MNILWRNSEKKPSEGDIKIMKNGDLFIRGYRADWAMYNDRYIMVWYPFNKKPDAIEPRSIDRLRQEYLEKGNTLFRAQSNTKIRKTRTVTLDLTVEADRQTYMAYFKCDTISDGVTKVTLSLYI